MTPNKLMTLSALKQMCRNLDKDRKKVSGFVRAQPVADEYGVYAAKVRGDGAVVLDFKTLSAAEMEYLLKAAKRAGISAVFQVTSSTQVDSAVRMGAENIQILNDPASGFSNGDILRKMVPGDIACFTENDAVFIVSTRIGAAPKAPA